MHILDIPREVLELITVKLNPKEYCRLRLTCTLLYHNPLPFHVPHLNVFVRDCPLALVQQYPFTVRNILGNNQLILYAFIRGVDQLCSMISERPGLINKSLLLSKEDMDLLPIGFLNRSVDLELKPFHVAAYCGHLRVCRVLIEQGAHVDGLDSMGRTPLLRAIEGGHEQVCRLLLRFGADQNLCDKNGEIPLHMAAIVGNVEICKVLLDYQSNIHCRENSGRTPLHYASQMWELGAAKLLIEYGARVDVKDHDNETPLFYAARGYPDAENTQQAYKMCEYLLDQGAQVNKRGNGRDTPLFLSVASGDLRLCELFLSRGAEILVKNDSGETPLLIAAQHGFWDICKYFVEWEPKAVPEAVDKDGNAVLHAAATEGNLEMCKIFLQNGADLWDVESRGRTCLMMAAQHGHAEVCDLLMDLDPRLVNAVDEVGNTALLYTVRSGDVSICEKMCSLGADVNVKNEMGWTPMLIAGKRDRKEICEWLYGKGAKVPLESEVSEDKQLKALHKVYQYLQLSPEKKASSPERGLGEDEMDLDTSFVEEEFTVLPVAAGLQPEEDRQEEFILQPEVGPESQEDEEMVDSSELLRSSPMLPAEDMNDARSDSAVVESFDSGVVVEPSSQSVADAVVEPSESAVDAEAASETTAIVDGSSESAVMVEASPDAVTTSEDPDVVIVTEDDQPVVEVDLTVEDGEMVEVDLTVEDQTEQRTDALKRPTEPLESPQKRIKAEE